MPSPTTSKRNPDHEERDTRERLNVLQGSTITYNVDVKNIGAIPLTALQVADTLPPGVTYVPESSKISGARALVQYLDQSTTQSYSNSIGEVSPLGLGRRGWSSATVRRHRPTAGSRSSPTPPRGTSSRSGETTTAARLQLPHQPRRMRHRHVELRLAGGPGPHRQAGLPRPVIRWRNQLGRRGRRSPARRQLDARAHSLAIPAQFRVATAQLRFRTATNNGERFNVDNVRFQGFGVAWSPPSPTPARPPLWSLP